MPKILFTLAALLALTASHAAILVTSESEGQTTRQYFSDGAFVVIEGDRPAFGIDAAGNCWVIEDGTLISDPCETVFETMSRMQQQMMDGLDPQQRAMMEQMMGGAANRPRPTVTPAGSRDIAGFSSECHRVGEQREICVSRALLDLIVAEMGNSRFLSMVQRFRESAQQMGGVSPDIEVAADLMQQGYPMADLQQRQQVSVPGLNSAMLQFLPEAQRQQLLQQLGGAGQPAVMQGMQVVAVERNADAPALRLSDYPRRSFRDYLAESMAAGR